MPSTPRSATAKSVDLDVLKASWLPPATTNGEIGSYTIQTTKPSVEKCNPESLDKLVCYFKNVAPNTDYEVEFTACTLPNSDGNGGGCGSKDRAVVRTWATSKLNVSLL